MPNGWVHAIVDFLAFGRSYFDLHREKDEASKKLGPRHREIKHEWYQKFGKFWNFTEPFPDWLKKSIQLLKDQKGGNIAEKSMVSYSHDYWDRIWDDLSEPERRYRESFFIWILFNPEVLKDKFGLDVINCRILRKTNDCDEWENCSEVRYEYDRLCRYVEVVKGKSKIIREMLKRFG